MNNEKNIRQNATSTEKLVMYALLTAIVVVLQLLGSFIHFGVFSINLALVPIIIGAAIGGPLAGAWLGLVCAIVILARDSGAFLAVNVAGTFITVLAKGILSGLLAGCVYKLLCGKDRLLAVIAAGITCPVVNTGVFLIGCRVFFLEQIKEWGFSSIWKYMVMGIGMNFVVELLINLVLSSVIVRLIDIKLNKKY